MRNYLTSEASKHLQHLCTTIPERAVGTKGNREATKYFSEYLEKRDFKIDALKFDCMDWKTEGAKLIIENKESVIQPSPYTVPYKGTAELVVISEKFELKEKNLKGKIGLLTGDVVKEQLLPKNFKFYNPPEHAELHEMLEKSELAAIISATSRNPELAGGAYPFPFTEDGDFNIPSAFMKDVDGAELAKCSGQPVTLIIDACRNNSEGYNVSALKGNETGKRIIVCAHIDSKLGTPGAIDNASGVVILMLIGELLRNYSGNRCIELVALNGEDYYSTPGQLKYLEKIETENPDIEMVINIDGAGYFEANNAISTYNCDENTNKKIDEVFLKYNEFQRGEEWVQGDHSIFVQMGLKCAAITSSNMIEKLCYDVTHTKNDVPEIIDCKKLAEISIAITDYINSLK